MTRVGTWNLLHGRSLADGLVSAPRLRAAVAELGVDVLGLQEVDHLQPRSGGLDLTAEVAAAAGARAWRFVPALVGTPGERWRPATEGDAGSALGFGVGLVSRYDVSAWHVLRLPAARVRAPILLPAGQGLLWLRDEPRVAVAAVLRAPFGTVTAVTTHLSFVPGWNVVQLRRVSAWMRRLPSPQLLLGDLNVPSGVAAAVTDFDALARHRTYPAHDPRWQLDHVLGRGDLPAVRATAARAPGVSDHRALTADLGD